MRHLKIAYSLLSLAVLATACTDRPLTPTGPDAAHPAVRSVLDAPDVCGEETTVRLLAGQTINAGSVVVSNDETNLYVTYLTSGPWSLQETHLAVATSIAGIPKTPTGAPVPGAFSHSTTHAAGVTEFRYTIALADLGVEEADELIIAAHAVVLNAMTGARETGWGEGARFLQRGNWATYFGYIVQACRPAPGKDIVVFNDVNPFDDTGMQDANNVLMVQNLVGYTSAGPRGSATRVIFDCGRSTNYPYACTSAHSIMRSTITGAGFTLDDVPSSSGSITSVPADVKVIFLWTPMVAFTPAEINVLKQFAAEGGRVVFIGEWDGFYGTGIALENDFLGKMGALMTNIGEAVDCGYTDLPEASLRPHQVTTGMTGVRVACASVIVPGPQDYALFYDKSNTKVLAGVATIDLTPLPLLSRYPAVTAPTFIRSASGAAPDAGSPLNPASTTGQW